MSIPPPGEPLRVLIVDDCPDTTRSLAALVELWGHQVRTADDGARALEAVRTFRPDVVILDIEMPKMSGWELARRLRDEAGLRQTLLVAVSGYGEERHRRRSRAAGCQLHLIKPVDPTTLQRLLAARRSSREVQAEELSLLLTDLTSAAELVEAIDDPALQAERGWNLGHWRYQLVPWGVCFRHVNERDEVDGEVVAVSAAAPPAPAGNSHPTRVVVLD